MKTSKNIVIRVDPERRQWWKETMTSLLPAFEVFLWDEDTFDRNDIDFAIVWAPPNGMLASLPKLQAIFSVGAGISHITDDPSFPSHVPIIRTTGAALRQRMCEYMAMHVLRIHRRLPEIEQAARDREWKQFVEPVASHVCVGVMGAGNLGAAASNTLIALGYDVRTLSRQGKPVSGLKIYPRARMSEFLDGVNILISMLPGTPETDNIICKSSINKLHKKSWVINVGRGSQIVDEDLLTALDSDRLAGAVLDVFRCEPLPKAHPFWHHPKILITSHTASAIEPAVGGEIIATNLLSFAAGEQVPDLVDIEQGY